MDDIHKNGAGALSAISVWPPPGWVQYVAMSAMFQIVGLWMIGWAAEEQSLAVSAEQLRRERFDRVVDMKGRFEAVFHPHGRMPPPIEEQWDPPHPQTLFAAKAPVSDALETSGKTILEALGKDLGDPGAGDESEKGLALKAMGAADGGGFGARDSGEASVHIEAPSVHRVDTGPSRRVTDTELGSAVQQAAGHCLRESSEDDVRAGPVTLFVYRTDEGWRTQSKGGAAVGESSRLIACLRERLTARGFPELSDSGLYRVRFRIRVRREGEK